MLQKWAANVWIFSGSGVFIRKDEVDEVVRAQYTCTAINMRITHHEHNHRQTYAKMYLSPAHPNRNRQKTTMNLWKLRLQIISMMLSMFVYLSNIVSVFLSVDIRVSVQGLDMRL